MKFLEARDPQREKVSEADCAAKPDVTWPLVRTHPITGRRSLYLNPKNGLRIVTLADGRPAAQELSDGLVLNLTRRVLAAGTYRHAWRPGDLVLGVGPIDVQQASLDHVLGLLQRWRAPTVTLRLVREDDS